MSVAYFIRGSGESWAVIKFYPDDREEVVETGLAKETAIERCFALLEELPRRAPAVGEEPAEDITPRARRARQLTLKF